ncbi:MAG TPA: guanylate kinase [Melioribacteraceae bacterium]|nr:guanylate kinase [Melioribacteraceae bacterium]
MKGNIFVISAPSGTGKTTIIKKIMEIFPQLTFSISATTRERRSFEVEGKDYFFISEEEFKNKIENNEFVEWEKFYDYFYGTLKSFVNKKLEENSSLIFEVDVKGALSIKKCYPEAVLIFIEPPSIETIKQRLIQRNTESAEDFNKRISRADLEMSFKDKFDFSVLNFDLEKAINDVKKIIENKLQGDSNAN